MRLLVNPKFVLLLGGFVVSIAASPARGVELVKVDHQISKVPAKRAHIQLTRSEFRFNGIIVSQEHVLQSLNDLKASVVYCEADKAAIIPKGRVEEWASLIIESGGRFFYKQHRGSIDSADHCYEYKQAESGRREVLTPAPHTTGHTDP